MNTTPTTYLSHNHYAISDADAGRLARQHATAHRLPRRGYCVDIPWQGGMATLGRTTLCSHELPARARRWVWTLMPHSALLAA